MTLIRHFCFDLPLNRCFYWIWWMCNKCFFYHEVFCLRGNCRLSDYTLGYYDEFSNQVHVSCTNMYSNTASVSKDLLITNWQHYWHFDMSNQMSCKDIRFLFFTFKDVPYCQRQNDDAHIFLDKNVWGIISPSSMKYIYGTNHIILCHSWIRCM